MIDTHCHLDDLFAHSEAAQTRWQAAGVTGLVTMGTHPAQWPAAMAAAARAQAGGTAVWLALGVHPWWVDEVDQARVTTLLATAIANATVPVVAIGEIGLDAVQAPDTLPAQQALFARQLSVAQTHGLPVVLHERKTADQLTKVLRQYPGLTGVVHGFTGSYQQAMRLIDLGFCLGVGTALTHSRANRLRGMLALLPLDALLLESDAPFQPGATHRGAINEPAFLPETLQALATLRGLSPAELGEQFDANARRLFGFTEPAGVDSANE